MYRGKNMKRAPKNEFYYPRHDDKVYKWGQQKLMYPGGEGYTGKQMPGWMVAIADQIRESYDEPVNHAIIIKYDDGVRTHAPPHQDKLPEDTSFFVFSFGDPRRFDIQASVTDECHHKTKRGVDGEPLPLMQTVHGTPLVKTKQTAGPVVSNGTFRESRNRGQLAEARGICHSAFRVFFRVFRALFRAFPRAPRGPRNAQKTRGKRGKTRGKHAEMGAEFRQQS